METIYLLIGTDSQTISWWQMSVRGIILFFRCYSPPPDWKQTFGKRTVYDIVLAVILGSTLSRVLTANARFFPSIAAVTVIFVLHLVISKISLYNQRIERWLKGEETRIVANGEIDWRGVKMAGITPSDILEALRLNGSIQDLRQVKEAYLERSGKISIVK